MQFKFFLLCAFLLTTTQFATAQLTAAKAETNFLPKEALISESGEDWTLYADEENKLYYIDFELLSVNVSDIVVKDSSGKVLIQEKVFDLPVNTIYELDFSAYAPGNYMIELRSFTDVIRKQIRIK